MSSGSLAGAVRLLLACAVVYGTACTRGQRRADDTTPMPAPEAKATLTQFDGTPLTGPRGARSPAAATAPATLASDGAVLSARVQWFATVDPPAHPSLQPVGAVARLLVAQRGGRPVLPSARLTSGARVAISPDAAGAIEAAIRARLPAGAVLLSEETAALALGATAAWAVQSASADGLPRVAIQLGRTGARPGTAAPATTQATDTLQLGISLAELVTDADPDADERPGEAAPVPAAESATPRQELALVDLPLGPEGGTAAVVIPVRFDPDPAKRDASTATARFAVALISVGPAPDNDDFARQLAQARQASAEATERARASSSPPGGADAAAARGAVDAALALSTDAPRRRAALTFLTAQAEAPLAADLALLGDDAVLEAFAGRLREQAAAPQSEGLSRQQWSLTLDLVAIATLSDLQNNGRLTPELEAVLAVHTGEAGRRGGALDDLVRGVGTRADLETRLIAENFVYLEDSSPASRVRAFDWLTARGKAPGGFDPLADTRTRRRALEKALSQLAQPAAAPARP